jgi:hypothetical protein
MIVSYILVIALTKHLYATLGGLKALISLLALLVFNK